MMRSSGASSSWVLKTSRTASRTAIMPRMRAAADTDKIGRLEAVAVADDDRAVALGVSAVLDAGERFRVEDRQAAGRALRPSGCKRPRAGDCTARVEQFRRQLCLSSVGSAPRYMVPSSFIFPSIISGWRAKYSLTAIGPSGLSMRLKIAPGMARDAAFPARAFAQEQNVGGDFRSGIGFERGVGQADRAEQDRHVRQDAGGWFRSCLSIV